MCLMNGLLYLFCFWMRTLLGGLLLVFPLKSKLFSPCLARGSLTHNGQNINNDALDRPRPPFPLAAKQAMGCKRRLPSL